jgi:hypothetical protein
MFQTKNNKKSRDMILANNIGLKKLCIKNEVSVGKGGISGEASTLFMRGANIYRKKIFFKFNILNLIYNQNNSQ